MPHVAITGASTGIGEGLARRWAQDRCDLTLVARRRDTLEALATELRSRHGVRVHVAAADLGTPARCMEWVGPAEAELGPIDVLVNNAGRMVVGPTESIDPVGAEATLELMLTTPVRLSTEVGAAMVRRGRGTIVNVTSSAAFSWLPGMVHYNAAKTGLSAFSESLRAEWRGKGVNVVTVYPGPVRTRLAESSIEGYGPAARLIPIGTTDGLAELVVAAVERRRARVIYPRLYTFLWLFPLLSRAVGQRITPLPALADSDRYAGQGAPPPPGR